MSFLWASKNVSAGLNFLRWTTILCEFVKILILVKANKKLIVARMAIVCVIWIEMNKGVFYGIIFPFANTRDNWFQTFSCLFKGHSAL